jgi:hypothetical protein
MKQRLVTSVAGIGLSLFLATSAGAGSATSTWDRFLHSFTDSSSQLLPPDPCAKKYPNKQGLEYQCCSAQSASQIIVIDASGMFDCCTQGIIPAKPYELLTLKESQDCQRHQKPALMPFLTCVAPQQADFVDQCESLITATTKEKSVSFDGPKGTILIMPLCECPSPKPVSAGVCVNFFDVDAYALPCLDPKQKDYLSQQFGRAIPEDGGGNYILTKTMLESRCLTLGGKPQDLGNPEIVEDNYSMAYAPYTSSPELAPSNPNQFVPSDKPDEEKLCVLTKPQCPCKP